MSDDMTLQAMVMDDMLAWAPNVDAAHVGVAAQNDVVSLSGIVSSLAEKVAAAQVARQVKGIPGIAQRLSSGRPRRIIMPMRKSPIGQGKSSTGIRKSPTSTSGSRLRTVSSRAPAPSAQFQRTAVERDIRTGGVTDIVNLIEIRPSADQITDPAALYDKIDIALRRSAEVEGAYHYRGDLHQGYGAGQSKDLVGAQHRRKCRLVSLRCDPDRRSTDLREMTSWSSWRRSIIDGRRAVSGQRRSIPRYCAV